VCAQGRRAGTLLSCLVSNGGILTQPLLLSYHLFSKLHENRMNIGDFYYLAFFNSFNPSA